MSYELKPIMPTGHTPWDVYRVTRDAWAPHRGFTVDTPALEREDFTKTMHYAGYVNIAMHQGETKIIVSVLNRRSDGGNPIVESTEKFKLFYNSIPTEIAHLYVATPVPFDLHVVSFIEDRKLENRVTRLQYNHLKTVNPLGPDCSRHTLLDEKETAALLEYFRRNPRERLKPIYTNDAGYVWTGGEPGRIIKLTRRSRISGQAVDYRQIVARSSYTAV